MASSASGQVRFSQCYCKLASFIGNCCSTSIACCSKSHCERRCVSAGEEATSRFTAHRERVTAVAQLPASQGAELLVTAGDSS